VRTNRHGNRHGDAIVILGSPNFGWIRSRSPFLDYEGTGGEDAVAATAMEAAARVWGRGTETKRES
jgi:hypothetical protein